MSSYTINSGFENFETPSNNTFDEQVNKITDNFEKLTNNNNYDPTFGAPRFKYNTESTKNRRKEVMNSMGFPTVNQKPLNFMYETFLNSRKK